jgi:PD-(D/E)XK nuclease superfamily
MSFLQLGFIIKQCNPFTPPHQFHRRTLKWLKPCKLASSSFHTAATNSSDIAEVLSQTSSASETELLNAEELPIPYPKALSPSAIMEFKKCPQSFLFQYLLGLKQETSLALAKGSMCHSALEKLFDLEPQDRTLRVLQDLFRTAWSQNRLSDTYRILFEKPAQKEGEVEWDVAAEIEWGQSALKLLENYYKLEDPRTVVRPNPVKREIWLNSHLSIDPELGATGSNHKALSDDRSDIPTFHVRGIVDRLDMIRTSDSASKVSLRIVDYKTGTLEFAMGIFGPFR